MSFALRAKASVHRIATHFGDSADLTLRRNHTLKSQTNAAITTLAINGTKAAGATSLDLDAASLVRGGTLPVGVTFTIAGDATSYAVATADAVVDSSGELSSVAITPALAAEAADDAVVTLTSTYKDYTLRAARRHFFADEGGPDVTVEDWRFLVSAVPGAVDFNTKMDAAQFDGKWLTVKSVEPFEPGTQRAGLILAVAA